MSQQRCQWTARSDSTTGFCAISKAKHRQFQAKRGRRATRVPAANRPTPPAAPHPAPSLSPPPGPTIAPPRGNRAFPKIANSRPFGTNNSRRPIAMRQQHFTNKQTNTFQTNENASETTFQQNPQPIDQISLPTCDHFRLCSFLFYFFFLRKQPKFNFFLFIYLTTTVRFCNNFSLVGELEVTWANFHRASQ